MKEFDYQRLVIAYHGCDASVRDRVIQSGINLEPQPKRYDWLGHGVYFWEHGPARALEWANQQQKRGKIETPAVLGAVLHLGRCFDLLDSKFTDILEDAYRRFYQAMEDAGSTIPRNEPLHDGDTDHLLRNLDCAAINWTIAQLETDPGIHFHSVRGLFQEGAAVFPDSGIRRRSHIQIVVRDRACILGYFLPSNNP